AVEHAEQVVIGGEQQLGRVAERLVAREPFRVGVPVGTEDRKRSHACVQLASDRAHVRIQGKQAVGVQNEALRHGGMIPWPVPDMVTGVTTLRGSSSSPQIYHGQGEGLLRFTTARAKGYFGGWVDSRTTRCGATRTAVLPSLCSDPLGAINMAAASRPISRIGSRMVVSAGVRREAIGVSSKPMTDSSSGIAMCIR